MRPPCSFKRAALRRGAAAVLAVAALACSDGGDARAPEQPPVLLFAVDGLEWNVLLPLVQAGELPTIAALMERGIFGELRSQVPTASPAIWTTIATGKSPSEHGIKGFVYALDTPDGPVPRVFTSGHRRTKAFWNILSDAGLSADVIGWWITYPAEQIDGLMVSQTNTTAALHPGAGPAMFKGSLQEGVEGQVWPRAREAEVMETLQDVDARLPEIVHELFGSPPNPLGPVEQILWDETQWAFRADETYLRIAERRLAEGAPAAVTAVYLGEPDVVGHRFWRYAYPEQFATRPAPEQMENFAGLLAATYRRADRALASLLENLPADATVMVASDHGMGPQNQENAFRPEDPRPEIASGNHPDAPPGVLIAAGHGIRSQGVSREAMAAMSRADLGEVGSVLDVTPTLLVLLGLPYGEDMEGRPLLHVLDPDLLARRPPRRVPTHDTPEWLQAQARFRVDSRDLSERLEQLRALGYVR